MNTNLRFWIGASLAILMASNLTTVLKAQDTSTASSPSVSTSTSGSSTAPATPSSWLDNMPDSTLPVHFGLNLSETYDDNIFLQPSKTYDWITAVSPSALFTMGDQESANENYVNLFYQPTFLIYANNSNQDNIEENVNAQYSHTFTKLRLGIGQQYQKLSDATVDSNNIVNRDVYTTRAIADYDYSDKLSIHGVATQTWTNYANGNQANTREWDLNSYFLYDLTPKLKLGVGPSIGFLDQQYAPNQTYQQLLGHLQYQATGKITVSLAAGVEDRQYQYGRNDQVTPVFDLRGDYQATDSTSFNLSGHAETYASASLQGQNYQDIAVQGGVSQRFLQKFYVNINAGYDNSTYNTISSNATNTGRVDNYFFVKPGVSWVPNNWLNVSASYQYSKDNSNYNYASFNDSQYSISIQLKY